MLLDQYVSLFKTKTFSGVAMAVVGAIGGFAGYHLAPADIQTIINDGSTIVTLLGGLWALYGRLKAEKKATLGSPSAATAASAALNTSAPPPPVPPVPPTAAAILLLFLAGLGLAGCASTSHTPPGSTETPAVSKQGIAVYDVCVGLEAGINAAMIAYLNGILPLKPELVDGVVIATEGPCTDDKLIANSADLSNIIASLTAQRNQFPTAAVLSGQADRSGKPNKIILAIQFGQLATNLGIRVASAPNNTADALGKDMAAGFELAISNWSAARAQ